MATLDNYYTRTSQGGKITITTKPFSDYTIAEGQIIGGISGGGYTQAPRNLEVNSGLLAVLAITLGLDDEHDRNKFFFEANLMLRNPSLSPEYAYRRLIELAYMIKEEHNERSDS